MFQQTTWRQVKQEKWQRSYNFIKILLSLEIIYKKHNPCCHEFHLQYHR